MNRLRALAFVLAGAACAAALAEGADLKQLTDESRRVADQLVQQVRSELTKALDTSGPLRAIVVCKYSVPEISSSLSRKTGWKVSRVSLKPRNPALGAPDAWERKRLQELDARLARGEKAETLEAAEVVQEGEARYFRYLKALPVTPLCMSCHGPADQLGEAVRGLLAADYPHDQAIGYRLGQMRGAVTVKRPLD
jgi:hypothetical protein